jgi:hypothetical protein
MIARPADEEPTRPQTQGNELSSLKKRQGELQAEVDRWLAAQLRPQTTGCTATSVATNCPTGSPTSRSGSPGSPRAEKQKSREAKGHKKNGKPPHRHPTSLPQRHSAISPIRKAAFSKPGMASSRRQRLSARGQPCEPRSARDRRLHRHRTRQPPDRRQWGRSADR